MPQTADFRKFAFKVPKVEATGKFVGGKTYWKIFAVENSFRVIIHSVLSAQIGSQWWNTAVDPKIQSRAQVFRQDYVRQPWHTSPGSHDIYYTHLRDLTEIIRANSHLFRPAIREVDQWIARIEQLRLPRNIVGHMNYPTRVDRKRVDVIHADTKALIRQLETTGLALLIP